MKETERNAGEPLSISFSLIVAFSASLPPCFHLPYVSDIIPGLNCIFLSLENSLLDRLQLGGQWWPSLSISLGIRSNLSPMCFFAVYLEPLKCKSLQPAARETRFSRASDWPPQPVPRPRAGRTVWPASEDQRTIVHLQSPAENLD